MNRTTGIKANKQNIKDGFSIQQQIISDLVSRANLAARLGSSYNGKRNLYQALGYPDEKQLNFLYYYGKYQRQGFAKAIINRPTNATWKGSLNIVPKDGNTESELSKAWTKLDERLKVKQRLCKADKLCGIGRFSLILFGFNDVKKPEDFKRPVTGKRELLYIKQIAESEVTIDKYEENTQNERYGLPLYYKIKISTVTSVGGTSTAIVASSKEIEVHYTRVIHIVSDNLTSEVVGTPRLEAVINNLIDLEKVLGGDAEMFWRGARPGYTAIAKDDYELGEDEQAALQEELDKYEHDLRRFITGKGLDIKALETQVTDPNNHVDVQLQAISAETGIPKRILVGSERGELASSQDADEWKDMTKTRREEEAEPGILRPFIKKCMDHGVLPVVEEYNVMWEDIFAPSEAERVTRGKMRADALKVYSDSPIAADILPPKLAYKHLFGLSEEQAEEALQAAEEDANSEQDLLDKIKEDADEMKLEQEVQRTKALPPIPTGGPGQRPVPKMKRTTK